MVADTLHQQESQSPRSKTINFYICLPTLIFSRSLFVLFEFTSFRPIRTIAGPGGVIGPLPMAK